MVEPHSRKLQMCTFIIAKVNFFWTRANAVDRYEITVSAQAEKPRRSYRLVRIDLVAELGTLSFVTALSSFPHGKLEQRLPSGRR